MVSSQMASIGQPEPRQVRVFSTMNSPPPFAITMLGGLILLLSARAAVQWLAGVPGYIAFLLSLVRTAWLGWILALAVYGAYLSSRARLRVMVAAAGLALMVVPLVSSDSLQAVVPERLASLKAPRGDESYRARLGLYLISVEDIVGHPLGRGHGTTGGATLLDEQREGSLGSQGQRTLDSGVIDVLRTLGWAVGAELFLGGTLMLLVYLARRAMSPDDPFADAARAVAIALFASMLSFNTMIGAPGAVFWGCTGLVLAAHRFSEVGGRPKRPPADGRPRSTFGRLRHG
jgi:hypothetical protein